VVAAAAAEGVTGEQSRIVQFGFVFRRRLEDSRVYAL